MSTPCQIVIEGIQAGPPYTSDGLPTEAIVVARSSHYCDEVHVQVHIADAGSQNIADQNVTVDFSGASSDPALLPGLITLRFDLPPLSEFRCGDLLFVEITCVADEGCTKHDWFPIQCKPAPGEPGSGSDNGNGNGNGGHWPPLRCLFTAAAAAFALLAALACIAIGIGTQNPTSLATGIALLGASSLAWALWAYWCGPGLCVRLAVLCWVFKCGFLAAIPVLFFSTNMVIILVIIAYGSIAGLLVEKLRKHNCPVPSARQPLTQIPI
ncbi:MAG TPA: hypothetical protein VLL54_02845 [Pyrinomonadaceae bacterium]|nr:hypothetical protein [Pyrinomonadaceae bacterium]